MENKTFKYETMITKIFQCGRFEDPLGVLSSAECWYGLFGNEFSREHTFMTWAVLARLRSKYLNGVDEREDSYDKVNQFEGKIFNATTNDEIIQIMEEMCEIVDELNLDEFPHLTYAATNDKMV